MGFAHKQAMRCNGETRARGVAGLTRLPVTEEIAGSNPVGPANRLLVFRQKQCKINKKYDHFKKIHS